MNLEEMFASAKDFDQKALPLESWNPSYCGTMDLIIKADGTWVHEGSVIQRQPLIQLFSRILRREADGSYVLVTPAEKITIQVERAPFLVVDFEGGGDKPLFITTNIGDTFPLSKKHPIVLLAEYGFSENKEPQEIIPSVLIRKGIHALFNRAVYYRAIQSAVERKTEAGWQLGLISNNEFYALSSPSPSSQLL
ncbi:MAG: DUF1285 domain-containing protein [Pseudomonadota bacterium]